MYCFVHREKKPFSISLVLRYFLASYALLYTAGKSLFLLATFFEFFLVARGDSHVVEVPLRIYRVLRYFFASYAHIIPSF